MLVYCEINNFGDMLNPWLWPKFVPKLCEPNNSVLFFGIGTILRSRVPADVPKVVFGSGWAGTGKRIPKIDSSWRIYCVRGPLTAASLQINPELALTDPAILLRRLTLQGADKKYKVSFMPHHHSMNMADWSELCNRVGIHCIDPRNPVPLVIQEIRETEILLAEAMHGAIVADAFRVPWIPVFAYGQINEFKWKDWTSSLDVTFEPVRIEPIFQNSLTLDEKIINRCKRAIADVGFGKEKWKKYPIALSSSAEIAASLRRLEKIPKISSPRLSDDSKLENVEERLWNCLSDLCIAYQ